MFVHTPVSMIFKLLLQVVMILIGHFTIHSAQPVVQGAMDFPVTVRICQASLLAVQTLMVGHLSLSSHLFLTYQPIFTWLFGRRELPVQLMMILILPLKQDMVAVMFV